MSNYDDTNKMSLWVRDKGPVNVSGKANIGGKDYQVKLVRCASQERSVGALLIEDENYVPRGHGFLYEPKFDDQLCSGKVMLQDKSEYYVSVRKWASKKSDKSPDFGGIFKPVDDTHTSQGRGTSSNDDW